MNKEEFRQKHIGLVKAFLERDEFYDFAKFASLNSCGYRKISEWIKFVKENLSSEEYKEFVTRTLPFETGNIEKNQELRKTVASVATRIFQYKAGLIDIIDEVTPSIEKYLYMVKQLRFNYKEVSAHVFNKNLQYTESVKDYAKYGNKTMEFPDVSLEDREKIKKVLTDRDLPINDVTYLEAYEYAIRNSLIKKSVKSR